MGLLTKLGLKKPKRSRSETSAAGRNLARAILAGAKPYHPLGDHTPARMKRPDRAFHQRWEVVFTALRNCDATSFCDLGCAEGYYVRRAAREHGIFAIGIDNDQKRLQWANAVSTLDDDWSCGFVHMDLSSESLRSLPSFDVIACMSLMHHVIYRHGLEEAGAMLSEISTKIRKCMIFDMGGPNETENKWAPSLSMFAGDVDANIARFLSDSGFTNIRILGRSVGYNTATERAMFVAEPPSL